MAIEEPRTRNQQTDQSFHRARSQHKFTLLIREGLKNWFLGDGWRYQNGWFFGKVPKGGGEVIFNPKIYSADFGPLYGTLKKAFWEKFVILKMRGRGGGQRPLGIFPKIHPVWHRHPALIDNTKQVHHCRSHLSSPALSLHIYMSSCEWCKMLNARF